MADTFARMRQLIGSTAEWAANNIVLGSGELGIERVSATEYKAKVGDGTSKWSLLPYLTAPSGITAVIQAALDGKLALAGGTMTGNLILARDGVQPKEAVTVTQLNNEVTKLNTAVNGKLAIAGGTMTGPLTLARNAINPLEAATFQQLNSAIANLTTSFGNISFAGSINPTVAYAAPVPAPVNGSMYSVGTAGAVDPSWNAQIAGTPPTTVGIGDQFIWSTTDSKFHYFQSAHGTAFVPLAGTSSMTGGIVWSGAPGAQAGNVVLSGKGGSITDVSLDLGTY